MYKHYANIILIGLCLFLTCGHENHTIIHAILITVFILNISLGVFEIRTNYFLKSIHSVSSNKVILTFDDGPNDHTLKVANTLKKHNVGAIFFTIGERMENTPQIVEDLKKNGFVIGNHSFNHSWWLAFMSTNRICNELQRTEDLIGESSIKIFRPPFGITSPQISRAVRRLKLRSIGWHVRTLDTVVKEKNKLIHKIHKQAKKGSIILLHEAGNVTSECIEEIITTLRNSGKELATNEDIKTILHA